MRKSIIMGAMAPPIHEQLGLGGPPAKHSTVWHWQEDADAISRLAVRGLLSQGEVDKARKRLMRTMEKESRELSAA